MMISKFKMWPLIYKTNVTVQESQIVKKDTICVWKIVYAHFQQRYLFSEASC